MDRHDDHHLAQARARGSELEVQSHRHPGLIYLGYLYARHPERVRETRRIFIIDEPQPVAAGRDAAEGTPDTGA